MAFTDEMTMHMKAGRGGNGVMRLKHEKGKEFAGPSGGDGGKGGDVIIRAIRDVHILSKYRNQKEFLRSVVRMAGTTVSMAEMVRTLFGLACGSHCAQHANRRRISPPQR